jgi:hypothetical protein
LLRKKEQPGLSAYVFPAIGGSLPVKGVLPMAKRKPLKSDVEAANWLQSLPPDPAAPTPTTGKGALSALAALIHRRGGQKNVQLANSLLNPLVADEHVTVQPDPEK